MQIKKGRIQGMVQNDKKGRCNKGPGRGEKKLEKSLDKAKQRLAALKTIPLKIKTKSFPTTITEEKINLALAAEGGAPPYTWELKGKLPRGLFFNRIAGTISGIAKSAGKYKFKIKLTDARGLNVKSKEDISFHVIKKYEEQKKKVSKWFVIMAAISSLLLLYILWGKYKNYKACKEMINKGYKAMWVRD